VISVLLFTLVIIYSMQVLTPGITGALNLISTRRTHHDHDAWIVFPDKASRTTNVGLDEKMLTVDVPGSSLNLVWHFTLNVT